MTSKKKINFINNVSNKILYYSGKLYKVITINNSNLYAFEYVLNKKLRCDVSDMFNKSCHIICYLNFSNILKHQKEKIKVWHILNEDYDDYKIIDNIQDVSNLYFIVNMCGFDCLNIMIKDNFKESLFNIDSNKLKDIYDIKTIIHTMTNPLINIRTNYNINKMNVQLHMKKYFNRKYKSHELKELCETYIEYIDPTEYEEYININ